MRQIVRVLVAVIALPMAGCSGGGGGTDAIEAYCDVFWDGAVRLHSQYESANEAGDVVSQLLNTISSPNDFAVLFTDMADVAPDDIRSDTEAVRDAFGEIARTSGDALTDPLGALAGNVGTGLAVSGSYERVNDYIDEHCPPPPGVEDPGGEDVPVAEVCGDLQVLADAVGIVTPETRADALFGPLREFRDAVHGELGDRIDALLGAIDDLDPPPMFGHEALARLAYDGYDPVSLLKSIDGSMMAACETPVFGDDAIAAVGELRPMPGPRRDSATLPQANLYGQDCGTGELLPSFRYVLRSCGGDGGLAIVDLETGVVTRLSDIPSDAVLGDELATWIEVDSEPARGLEPPSWESSLVIAPYSGEPVTRVRLAGQSDQPAPTFAGAVLAVGDDRVLVSTPTGDVAARVLLVDGSGTAIAEHASDTLDLDATRLVELSYGVLVDKWSGTLFELMDGSIVSLADRPGMLSEIGANLCGDRAVVQDADGNTQLVDVAGGSASVTRGPTVGPAASIVRPGILVLGGLFSAEIMGLNASGDVLWSLPDTVARDVDVVGGWVVITNVNRERVIVDPATGEEASVAPWVRPFLESGVTRQYVVDIAAATVIAVDGDGLAERHPFADLCPR